ncbi:response regulator transcription factor [Elizabethkingia sp. JS20170427COW]|uniref:response regulator transcription factor n=1 Tax=Elizabethkingia sp. JS20170427COW TaxID=2583851 RepID=UPI0011103FCB|nr:response regulator transcription factor [Elizabethkingia sp. JS20170427COW]QCX54085.1 response regulator transcription factor [Elizabethkingia sp. JS20170427COW]
MKILVIEDEATLNQNICEALQSESFEVHSVYDGLLAERFLKKDSFDCIILDINLPQKNGYDVCKDFRIYNSHTPILILTAFDELEDKIKGFNYGADDYLTKPFFMKELMMRVKALIKRSKTSSPSSSKAIVSVGDISIHKSLKKVSRGETEIPLTPREYQILLKLCETPGEIVSKNELIKEIWGNSFDINTNTVEVYVNFLRNKIDKPFHKNTIKTKVGYGYYLDTSE